MATATKKRKKTSKRKGMGLAGLPPKNQIAPILKATAMLALGLVAGYAANDMISGAMKSSTATPTEGFDVKGLIAPALTVVGGMMLVGNPNTKYVGLGLSAAGALKGVSAVMKKDPLTLPELRFIKYDTASVLPAATTPSTPVAGIGSIPYLEFDESDDEPIEGLYDDEESDYYAQNEVQEVSGVQALPVQSFL